MKYAPGGDYRKHTGCHSEGLAPGSGAPRPPARRTLYVNPWVQWPGKSPSWATGRSSPPLQHRQQSTQRIRFELQRDLQGTSSGPVQDVFPAQHLTLDLHWNEARINSKLAGHENLGSWPWPGSPAQQACVAQSLFSGEGKQRESAASVVSENPSDLVVSPMSPGRADD